jgi:hypothetical protein
MGEWGLNFSIFSLFQQDLLIIIGHMLWKFKPVSKYIALEHRNLLAQICNPISNMHYIDPKT